MAWYTACTIAAAIIYLLYNAIAVRLFGVPSSLSDTFYLYKSKKDWMRIAFPLMMLTMAILLMPSWLTISEGSPWQFTSFLAAASIIFVGSTPGFKEDDMTNKVHLISAIIATVMSISWICLVANMWYMVIAWLILVLLLAYASKTFRKSTVYWLETAAYMATFSSILAYEMLL